MDAATLAREAARLLQVAPAPTADPSADAVAIATTLHGMLGATPLPPTAPPAAPASMPDADAPTAATEPSQQAAPASWLRRLFGKR